MMWTLPHIGKRVEASIEKQRIEMVSLRIESIVEELVSEESGEELAHALQYKEP